MDQFQKSGPEPGETSALWILKVFAGVLIIFVLGLHLVVNHLTPSNGLMSWQDVVDYYQHPAIPILEGVFLGLVLGHGALGLRGVLLDLNLRAGTQRVIDWVIGLATLGFFAYGLSVLIRVAGLG